MVCLVFILCLVFSSPLFYVLKVDKFSICAKNWDSVPNGSIVYTWILLVFSFLLPASTTFVLYFRIIKSLKERTSANKCEIDRKRLEERLKANKQIMFLFICLLVALVFPNRLVWIIKEMMMWLNIEY